MEHVPLPPDSIHPVPIVPYICSESPGMVPFAEAIQKTQWNTRLTEIFEGATDVSLTEWSQLSVFFQDWLFFGLLSAFLGSNYHLSDFVSQAANHEGSSVTTERLNDLLRDFAKSEIDAAEEERKVRHRERATCLRTTSEILAQLPQENGLDALVHLSICLLYEKLLAVNALVEASWKALPPYKSCVVYGRRVLKRFHPQPGAEPLPDNVRSSIAEILTSHGVNLNPQSTTSPLHMCSDNIAFEVGVLVARSEAPAVNYSGPPLKFIKDRLTSDGWCPSERSLLMHNYNATCQFYAGHLCRPGLDKDHVKSNCSDSQCNAYKIDRAMYKTVHWPKDCTCEPVDVDLEQVNKILSREVIPAVILQQQVGTRVIPVETTEKGSYVAISHVWSDGLGNVQANALPICQLDRLRNFFRDNGLKVKPVWIDTLCCPREPIESRRAAIKLMRQTYEDAQHVFVLDRWLNKTKTSGLSRPEIMFRIALSGWTRRLWTLQEGMLNISTLVCFQDRMVDIDGLAQNILLDQNIEYLPMVRHLAAAYGLLRGMMRRNLDIRTRLTGISLCLQLRSTSWAGDEALCLSALLDLKVEKIWDQKIEDRMKELWIQVSDVPVDVAFDITPKLTQIGFRWSPSTLLGHSLGKYANGTYMAGRWTKEPSQELAKVTDSGLLADVEGFIGNVEISNLMQNVSISMLEFIDQNGQPYMFFRRAVPRDPHNPNSDPVQPPPPEPLPDTSVRWAILTLGYRLLPLMVWWSPAILGKTEFQRSSHGLPRNFKFVSYGYILKFQDQAQHARIRPFQGSFVASEQSLDDSASMFRAMHTLLQEGSIPTNLVSELDTILEGLRGLRIQNPSGRSDQFAAWTFENIRGQKWLID